VHTASSSVCTKTTTGQSAAVVCVGHTQQPTALVPTAIDVDIAQLTAAVSACRKLLCGMDRFVLTSLLQIYKKMYRGKNLEHRLRFDIGIIMFMTLVYCSLVHRVGLHFISRRVSPTVSHTHAESCRSI